MGLVGLGSVAMQERPADAATASLTIEAESMSLSPGAGTVFADHTASGGSAVLLWANGSISATVPVPVDATAVSVTARGDHCDGGPVMTIAVDGVALSTGAVRSTSTWGTRVVSTPIAAGSRQVSVSFTNDHLSSTCDRNLRLDRVTFTLASPPEPTHTNPLALRPFHVSSWTSAGHAASQIRSTRPADAAELDILASTPSARWLGEWSGDIRAAADQYVGEAAADGRMPVLVAYSIPQRDCGSYSGGGLSADTYGQWIRDLGAGIGDRPAVVILEPDAVALADCLSSTDRSQRYRLLSDAISTLSSNANTVVYLDAGHSDWHSPDEMASRLEAAGVANARGVSLNVSNFGTTNDQIAYARALRDRIGVQAVIDTSRNGNGSNGEWCNPVGRAIGAKPSATTTDPGIDAYLWVKTPGESDGTCNGGPGAGQFWIDGALALLENAGP